MDGVGSILGGRSSWWTVLIPAALFLLAHVGPTETCGDIPITADPARPRAGQDVWFFPSKIPDHFIYCIWMQEEGMQSIAQNFKPPNESLNTQEPGNPGRLTMYPNCSLHIRDLNVNDSKAYVLKAGAPLAAMFGSINLEVSDTNPAAQVSVVEPVFNFNITMDPLEPGEGGDLWFMPVPPLKRAVSCVWSRGNRTDRMQTISTFVRLVPKPELGPGYTGREIPFRSCSLCIGKLTLADSATYTLTANFAGSTINRSVTIQVSAAPVKGFIQNTTI